MQLLVDYHRKHSNQEMIIHDSLDKLLKHLESNSETFWMSYKKTNVGFLTGRIVECIGDRVVIQESYLGENTNLREVQKKSIVFLLTGDEYSIREDLLKMLLKNLFKKDYEKMMLKKIIDQEICNDKKNSKKYSIW